MTSIRRLTLPFLLLVVVGGCSSKHEASTGKEWLEKFQAAAGAQDVETVWKMHTKASQEFMSEKYSDWMEVAKSDPEGLKQLKKSTGLDDPSTRSGEELAKAFLKALLKKKDDEMHPGKYVFVSEKKEGEQVILVLKIKGKKEEFVLLEEDGYLKFDIPETGRRETKRSR